MAKSKPLVASAPYGRGGSYTTDPATGIRVLVTPATALSAPCCTPSAAIEPAPEPEPIALPEQDANLGEHSDG